jgi:hypothetical protein
MPLRPYQQVAFNHAMNWFSTAKHGQKIVYEMPTGTGKSYIEKELLSALPDALLITPRIEIQAGLLEKMGVTGVPLGEVTGIAESHGIYTPIRLRNVLSRGIIQQPGKLIVDEGHHGTADTYELLDYLTGQVPSCAFTATAFRGTPKATAAFQKRWGRPVVIMAFGEAAREGVLSTPKCRIVPLIDDDTVEVCNGEFIVTQLDSAIGGVIPQIVKLSWDWQLSGGGAWDRPTMYTVPTVKSAYDLATALHNSGIPTQVVTGETPYPVRQAAFKLCVECEAALVQVNVVSEGVDLPIRRLIDLRPTLSPVLWMQTFGRITRPVRSGEESPEYVCCCRNLLRHAYLLDGVIPSVVIAECENSFGGVGIRGGLRVLGFEGLGRFKATELPLLDGTTGLLYAVSAVEGQRVTQYCVMSAPNRAETLIAKRERGYGANWDRSNRWIRCDMLPDLSGFASIPPTPLTEKQNAWWKRSAATRGLNPEATVNARSFQAMPVLFDIKGKLV